MKKPLIDNKNILKNAIVTYNSGEKEIFEAIMISDKVIYTGFIKLNKKFEEKFIDDGLISKENIQNIIVLDNDSKSQIIEFKL